jgi:hypothetical protein
MIINVGAASFQLEKCSENKSNYVFTENNISNTHLIQTQTECNPNPLEWNALICITAIHPSPNSLKTT